MTFITLRSFEASFVWTPRSFECQLRANITSLVTTTYPCTIIRIKTDIQYCSKGRSTVKIYLYIQRENLIHLVTFQYLQTIHMLNKKLSCRSAPQPHNLLQAILCPKKACVQIIFWVPGNLASRHHAECTTMQLLLQKLAWFHQSVGHEQETMLCPTQHSC